MSDTTTPYVSDEQIKQYASQYVAPYATEVKRACDHIRDLYEARLSEVIRERDEARERADKAMPMSQVEAMADEIARLVTGYFFDREEIAQITAKYGVKLS